MSLIAAVEGVLEGRGADFALVRVGGVTFQVYVPAPELARLDTPGGTVRLSTHLVVREDDLQLYGFSTHQGRRLFQLLLEVGGVGPRVALAVLSVLSPEEAALAIVGGDIAVLSSASGVGKRTAERIVLELKGKLEEEIGPVAVAASQGGAAQDQAVRALLALGYTALEARQALSVEREEGLSVEERVRRALQRIGQG